MAKKKKKKKKLADEVFFGRLPFAGKPSRTTNTDPSQFYICDLRKMSLKRLTELEPLLPKGAKREWVTNRIEQMRKNRIEFLRSLEQMSIERLRQFTWPNCPRWQRVEAAKVIRRMEERDQCEFTRQLADKSLDELRMLNTTDLTEKQQIILNRLIGERHQQDVKRFRLYLRGLTRRELRSLLGTFSNEWQNEEIARQYEVARSLHRELQMQEFLPTLEGKQVSELEAMSVSVRSRWRQKEIIKKIDELRAHDAEAEATRIRAEYLTELKQMTIDMLLPRAISHPCGWENDLICDRIIELLPRLETSEVKELSTNSSAGLQRVARRAEAELKFRDEETNPVKPRVIKGWV